MLKDSEEAGPAGNQYSGVWMLVNITSDGMCISTFVMNGLWEEITARVNLKQGKYYLLYSIGL
jgi:hypothetical protein